MLRETGIFLITGIKRLFLVVAGAGLVVIGVLLLALLAWQLWGLFPVLSYFTNLSIVTNDAWAAAGLKAVVAIFCYFAGIYLCRKGVALIQSTEAPLEQDFHRSAELVSRIEANTTSMAHDIRRSVNRAVESAATTGISLSEFMKMPCYRCGSMDKVKEGFLWHCKQCGSVLRKS